MGHEASGTAQTACGSRHGKLQSPAGCWFKKKTCVTACERFKAAQTLADTQLSNRMPNDRLMYHMPIIHDLFNPSLCQSWRMPMVATLLMAQAAICDCCNASGWQGVRLSMQMSQPLEFAVSHGQSRR